MASIKRKAILQEEAHLPSTDESEQTSFGRAEEIITGKRAPKLNPFTAIVTYEEYMAGRQCK